MADFVISAALALKDNLTQPMTSVIRTVQALRRGATEANDSVNKLSDGTQEAGRSLRLIVDNTKQASNSMKDLKQNSQQAGRALDQITNGANHSSGSLDGLGTVSVTSASKGKVAMKLFAASMRAGLVAAAAAAGAAIAGIGVQASITANEIQQTTNMLQAQLGITKQQAEQMSQVGQRVFRNGWGADLTEVNNSLAQTKQMLGNIGDTNLQAITEGAFTIRDAFGAEMNESIRTAGVMTKNFGIDGKQAMDLITRGFQMGGNFSDELLDTMREYSPQFKTMGLSANQMMGILIKGAQAGAWNLDKVGDAVKEFNIRAQDGSKTTAAGFKAIHLDADKMGQAIAQGGQKGQQAFVATITALAGMKDKVAQNQAGVALFGTQWEDVRQKVIVAMAEGVKGIENVDDATKKAGESIQGGLIAKLTQLYRIVSTDLGNAFKPVIELATKVVGSIIQAWPSIKAAISSTIQSVKEFGSMLGSFLAPVFNAVAGFGKETFASIRQWWERDGAMIIKTAQNVGYFFKGVFMVILPVVKLVWFVVKAIIVGVWENIKGVISGAIGIITNTISLFSSILIGNWRATWESVKGLVGSALQFVWNLLNLVFLGRLLQPIRAGMTFIRSIITAGWNFIRGIFTNSLASIRTTLGFFQGFYVNIFKTAFGFVRGIAQGGWSFLKGLFVKGWEALKITTQEAITAVKAYFKHFVDNAKLAGQEFIDSLITGIKSKIDGVITACKEVWDAIVEFFSGEKEVKANVNVTPKANTGVDGSFAKGLDYVPRDGFIAELHKGERVLTAKENQEYSSGRRVMTPTQVRMYATGEASHSTAITNNHTSITNTSANVDKSRPTKVEVHYHAASGQENNEFQRFATKLKSAMNNMG